MVMRLLIVTAVEGEARAIAPVDGAHVIVSGLGRTNAAAATTEALVRHNNGDSRKRIDAVISAGLAGVLPGGELKLGDCVIASQCIYVEEGLISPTGFADMAGLGFPLGDFAGNAVPVDERLLEALSEIFPIGPIATVATCSGTDAAAAEAVRRTGAVAEAMEGAAVVHAARRLGVPAIELRAISNTTGDRRRQQWDIPGALQALGIGVHKAIAALIDR